MHYLQLPWWTPTRFKNGDRFSNGAHFVTRRTAWGQYMNCFLNGRMGDWYKEKFMREFPPALNKALEKGGTLAKRCQNFLNDLWDHELEQVVFHLPTGRYVNYHEEQIYREYQQPSIEELADELKREREILWSTMIDNLESYHETADNLIFHDKESRFLIDVKRGTFPTYRLWENESDKEAAERTTKKLEIVQQALGGER